MFQRKGYSMEIMKPETEKERETLYDRKYVDNPVQTLLWAFGLKYNAMLDK